jgi:hypothetical protein
MDKIKLLTYSVIGLVLLNIGIIGFLYLSRPNPNRDDNRKKPKDIIIVKLHFDATQEKKYEEIINVYRNKIDSLNNINREIKAELYSQLKQPSVSNKIKDSLIKLILVNQKIIEETNFNHFQDIKSICNKSQIDNFNDLTEELEKLFSNTNRKPRHEFSPPPRLDFDEKNKVNKGNLNLPPPPMDENRPPPPPRDGNRPPPPPHWNEEEQGRLGDAKRPSPPPRDIDEK